MTTPKKTCMALPLFLSPCRPHSAIALTSQMRDLGRPVIGNYILDKESGMERRIQERTMRWQRHLVSRNLRKSGPRKGSLKTRLIRRRNDLHLNLSNTDRLHRSHSSHLSSRNLSRYATLCRATVLSRCCVM